MSTKASVKPKKLQKIDDWRIVDKRVVGWDGDRVLVWLLLYDEDGSTQWYPYYLDSEGNVVEKPVYAPLPGSQFLFLSSPVFETMYAGNRGGGKCVDEGDVLTPSGWRDIRAMRAGDPIYTFDADGEMIESVVSNLHVQDYDGEMVRREGRGIYMSFTPNHKLPVPRFDQTFELIPYEDAGQSVDVLRSIVRWQGKPLTLEQMGQKYRDIDMHDKRARIPRFVLDAEPEILRVVLDLAVRELGFWRENQTNAVMRTKNVDLANDISEIGVKLGFNVDQSVWRVGSGQGYFLHQVVLKPGQPARLYEGGERANVRRDPFKGKVYCVEVPFTHTFVIRQRGKVWLSGNSDSLLLSFASGVGRGYGKGYRGILFRKEFGDLDDIVRKVETIFPRIYGDEFRFLKSKSEYTCQWLNGEALLLRNLPNEDAYREYHGHSYAWIGFEELTQWGDDKAYRLMFSCARSPAAGVPVVGIRSTTNPYGIGHNWVKKRFRLPQGFGKVIRVPGEVPRVAIQSDLRENFVLLHNTPNYPDLIRQAAANPAQAAAWLHGDWNVTTGGMFDDLWNAAVHVIPNFSPRNLPASWRLDRSYDHGQAKPFCTLWWAESSGEPIQLPNGRIVGQVPGDIILFAEWYGTTGQPDEGIRMQATKIGLGIRERERDMGITNRVRVGPADINIWGGDDRGTNHTVADDMASVGVHWERAEQKPGSRFAGYQNIRTFMSGSIPNEDGSREYPGLFVCERCLHWLELVPTAPRSTEKPDELPKKYEDHPVDATRYRLSREETAPWRKGF